MEIIIALLISIGIITSPDQATPELIKQYETEIIILETNGM